MSEVARLVGMEQMVVLTPSALAGSLSYACPTTGKMSGVSVGKCGMQTARFFCSHCGDIHVFTANFPCLWKETGRTEPTMQAEGIIAYKCSYCGKTKSESIPKLEPVLPDDCTHEWIETSRTEPTEITPGQIIYSCSQCGAVRTEEIAVKPEYTGTFMNWLGSVLGLFNMTLNSIMGLPALRLFAGVLVFLTMFSLLAQLLRQGRKGRL